MSNVLEALGLGHLAQQAFGSPAETGPLPPQYWPPVHTPVGQGGIGSDYVGAQRMPADDPRFGATGQIPQAVGPGGGWSPPPPGFFQQRPPPDLHQRVPLDQTPTPPPRAVPKQYGTEEGDTPQRFSPYDQSFTGTGGTADQRTYEPDKSTGDDPEMEKKGYYSPQWRDAPGNAPLPWVPSQNPMDWNKTGQDI